MWDHQRTPTSPAVPVVVPLDEVAEVVRQLEATALRAKSERAYHLAVDVEAVISRIVRWLWGDLREIDEEGEP